MNDGHSIPALGFGLWEVRDARFVTETGLRHGYRLVDGAAIYGNEEGMGQGLRDSGVPRDEIFVTTKIWNDAQGHDSALRAADASLKRLGLDHVDLLLIHWPCPQQNLFVDTWRAMIRLRDEGRTRSIGVSNFDAAQIDRLTEETGVTPCLNQVELHPRLQQTALRAAHDARGVVTQSWTPLGQGRSFDDPTVAGIAARTGATPAQVVIAWHLALGLSVIPRSTREARLAENLAARDLQLAPDDIAAMAALDAGDRIGPDPAHFM
jgi:2,5-diketo-D-gluconate reductase A